MKTKALCCCHFLFFTTAAPSLILVTAYSDKDMSDKYMSLSRGRGRITSRLGRKAMGKKDKNSTEAPSPLPSSDQNTSGISKGIVQGNQTTNREAGGVSVGGVVGLVILSALVGSIVVLLAIFVFRRHQPSSKDDDTQLAHNENNDDGPIELTKEEAAAMAIALASGEEESLSTNKCGMEINIPAMVDDMSSLEHRTTKCGMEINVDGISAMSSLENSTRRSQDLTHAFQYDPGIVKKGATKMPDSDFTVDFTIGSSTLKSSQYLYEKERFDVIAPPGTLGVTLELSDDLMPVVTAILSTSVLIRQDKDAVRVGDRLVEVDGIDVTVLPTMIEISKLIDSKKNNVQRRLSFIRRKQQFSI